MRKIDQLGQIKCLFSIEIDRDDAIRNSRYIVKSKNQQKYCIGQI